MTRHDDTFQPGRPARRLEVWTGERIRALGAVTDLSTAASILGLSRAVAYDLAKTGRFPVPLIRVGTRYRVPVAAILAALHLDPQPPAAGGDLTRRRRRAWITTRKSAPPARSTSPPPEDTPR
jgi:predicted DNA-binding transcriptional regulator AlpA